MCANEMSAGQFGQSRSGSIADNDRYDGPSDDNEKFEGDRSAGANNPRIGKVGWGK